MERRDTTFDVERMEVISAKISKGKGNLECLEIILKM